MAKAVYFSLPLDGHVNPSLPVVRELAARGDEVVYYATDRFADQVRQAGARYRAYQDGSLEGIGQLSTHTDEVSWLLMRAAARVLEAEIHAIRSDRPDYLITDSVAPWGQWLGAMLAVPVVTSISTFAFNRQVLALGLARGVRPKSARRLLSKLRFVSKALKLRRQLCRTYGVKGPGVMGSVMGSSQLNIVYTSRHFQPCAETFDERYQFVGPSISGRVSGNAFDWNEIPAGVIVYVSLGTVFNRNVSFYRQCFEAFASEPWHVIMSVGSGVSLDQLAGAPGNVTLRPHVPQLAVLQRSSAFVTHGGMNSVSESLFFGVPLVVVPQMGEQAIVGRQVEALGAGLYLSNEEATASALRTAVRRILTEQPFKDAVSAVRRSFTEAGGPPRAADAIVEFTRRAAHG
jgi:MGT family glycosyltransferase